MAIDFVSILSGAETHAMASGLFESVGLHESLNPPGNGLRCEIIASDLRPVQQFSGLDKSSARLEILVSVICSLRRQPLDSIESDMLNAVSTLIGMYVGDFDLIGSISYIDVFGSNGAGVAARPGYIEIDGIPYRRYVITLPMIIDNAWDEVK